MKHRLNFLKYAVLLLALLFGASWAQAVKPIDSGGIDRIERRQNRRDISWLKGVKEKQVAEKANLNQGVKSLGHRAKAIKNAKTKRIGSIEKEMTVKNNKQVRAKVKLKHLRERLAFNLGGEGANKKLQNKIKKVEKRIAQRDQAIAKLTAKKEDVQKQKDGKLAEVDAKIKAKQGALKAVEENIRLVDQAIDDKKKLVGKVVPAALADGSDSMENLGSTGAL